MRHCEYVQPNGRFCGSPALRGRDYCYWHLTCVARRARVEKQQATCDPTPPELPPLEDANSIQLAIMTVMDAILHDRIGPRKANQLLYALQLASNNLKQGVNLQPVKQTAAENEDENETEDVVLCSSYDSLEADYGIQEHGEQLQADDPDVAFVPLPEEEAPEELTEVEQYFEDNPWEKKVIGFVPDERDLERWRDEKQRRAERYERHWDEIRGDLALAVAGEDREVLQDALADCYQRAGLEYETEGWKPASSQKVLFGLRKPPTGVQQQWYEQRQANCMAELDRLADQEAARKSSA